MRSLIKIPLLLVFLCISAFSDTRFVIYAENKGEFTRTNLESMGSGYYKELANGKYIYYKARGRSIESGYYFNSDTGISDGIYRDLNGNFFVVDSAVSLDTYCDNGFTFRALRFVECASSPVGKIRNHIQGRNSTKMILDIVAQCNADEDFNTDTHQCQKCPDGQSWDPQTNTCYKDCSKDGKINKVGLPDGRCIDCSGEKDSFAVLKCLCSGFGLGGGNTFWSKYGSSPSDCNLEGSCSDGSQISFINPKCSVKPDQKPDDNKTKPDNPNPDNNNTKPDDPNNPNQGGSNQGGNQGGNNGGNQGNNPKPNPNPGNNTNSNPDPKPNPKPGNNDGDKNKDADAKFNPGDFDYSDLKRDEEQFTNKFKGALDDVLKDFDGFKQGVDQFISNVRGKGLSDVNKHSKPTTCVKKYEIDFFGYKTSIEFDFCKVAATVSGAFYYIFYAFFFYCFLILIVKILLFAF
uniref:Neisseria meningitidis TspB protein n=1 Tax=Inoviridae sp. ctTUL13 TaxID=2825782 RepID=A0A8S5UQ38_9VIRU|nr:MAG TPA: Neisseria meningitidis TspB protein [Inoviridae sp. ctTUL13]